MDFKDNNVGLFDRPDNFERFGKSDNQYRYAHKYTGYNGVVGRRTSLSGGTEINGTVGINDTPSIMWGSLILAGIAGAAVVLVVYS